MLLSILIITGGLFVSSYILWYVLKQIPVLLIIAEDKKESFIYWTLCVVYSLIGISLLIATVRATYNLIASGGF